MWIGETGKSGAVKSLWSDAEAEALAAQHAARRCETPGNNWIKTGAHVMIVGSGAKMLDGYPRDPKGDATKPYLMWPGTPYEHLMLPVR